MTRTEALITLGFTVPSSPPAALVRAAFAEFVKRAHPDNGGDASRAGYSVTALKEARDLLLNATISENNACKLCRGTGSVHSRIGASRCVACHGTGERQ